jgi:hypothetical protein
LIGLAAMGVSLVDPPARRHGVAKAGWVDFEIALSSADE